MVFICCVSGCRNTNKAERMYSFPKYIEIAKKWLDIVGRQDLLQKDFERVRKSYRVCGVHFDDTCKFLEYHNRTNLKHDAIPTLYLPGKMIIDTIINYFSFT